MRLFFLLSSLLLCVGCANPNYWQLDTVDAKIGGCSRLNFKNPESTSPLRFEISRVNDDVTAYINLAQYRLSPGSSITIQLIDGEQIYEEETPLLEGRMRLRLSPDLLKTVVSILQEGRPVKFSIDGFEETLKSDQFTPSFLKLVKNSPFVQNILQGSAS